MPTTKPRMIAALLLAATATTAPLAADLPAGVWHAADYGYVLDIGRRSSRLYDVAGPHCVSHRKLRNAQVIDLLGEPVAASDEGLTLGSAASRYRFRPLDALPQACRDKPGRSPDQLAGLLLATLRAHHPSADGLARVHAALAQQQQDAAAADSDAAVFARLSALLAPLHDAHVTLSDGDAREFEASPAAIGDVPRADAPTWKDQRWTLKDYLDGSDSPLVAPTTAAGNRRLLVGELPSSIGYVGVLAMAGYSDRLDADSGSAAQAAAAARVFDEVFDALANRRGLVIDLRYNEGGLDAVALALAARLAAAPVRAYGKQVKGPDGLGAPYWIDVQPSGRGFDGPIAVLVGPYTISAAEVGALALSSLPNVQLIGEPTFGAWSDAMPKALPNGWSFTIAPELYLAADGTTMTAGLVPDRAAPTPVLGDPAARYRPAIEVAHAWVSDAAGHSEGKSGSG